MLLSAERSSSQQEECARNGENWILWQINDSEKIFCLGIRATKMVCEEECFHRDSLSPDLMHSKVMNAQRARDRMNYVRIRLRDRFLDAAAKEVPTSQFCSVAEIGVEENWFRLRSSSFIVKHLNCFRSLQRNVSFPKN